MVSGTLAPLYLVCGRSWAVAGQRPRQGMKSSRMGRFSVRPSVRLSVRPSVRPSVPPSRAQEPARQALDPAIQASEPATYGESPHSTGLHPLSGPLPKKPVAKRHHMVSSTLAPLYTVFGSKLGCSGAAAPIGDEVL